ncbi:MAG TPA: magnesium transporter [Chitinispirillaceae bacterium]|jgi:magnesium transporter|nr:magnesium transporter [Chitinispirillaceae bacterium]
MDELAKFIEERDLKGLRQWLLDTGTLEIAEALTRVDPEYRALSFRLLPKDRSLDVFEMLDTSYQQEILKALRESNVRDILENMEPDDRARLLDEMPPQLAKQLLEGLSFKERRLTSILLGYPENSAGRIMSPEFVELWEDMTVGDALAKVRRSGRGVEAIYSLPVVTGKGELIGTIDLGDLVMADPSQKVGEIVTEEKYFVKADQDQEEASRLLLETGLTALPVLDSENQLVGVLTFDDAMEVLQESDTEDIFRIGASEPLGTPYFSASLYKLTRNRAIWLLVLALAATLTVNVLNIFQVTLQNAIKLSLFIPLLIGIGGNIGSQSATIIIRAMALGEVYFSDLLRVLAREVKVGFLLGLIMGAISFPVVGPFFGWDIAAVLAASLLSIASLASFAGSILPMFAKRIGIDPAVMSAPVISTLVDASGLVIYFLIARMILGIG